jgi:hypothetical protein
MSENPDDGTTTGAAKLRLTEAVQRAEEVKATYVRGMEGEALQQWEEAIARRVRETFVAYGEAERERLGEEGFEDEWGDFFQRSRSAEYLSPVPEIREVQEFAESLCYTIMDWGKHEIESKFGGLYRSFKFIDPYGVPLELVVPAELAGEAEFLRGQIEMTYRELLP